MEGLALAAREIKSSNAIEEMDAIAFPKITDHTDKSAAPV
jgi:hypothetical protein